MLRTPAANERAQQRGGRTLRNACRGISILEIVTVLAIAMIMTAIAIPVMDNAMIGMKMNALASAIRGAISQTRYRSIMTNQTYTLVLTTPADTFVVTNTNTGIADSSVPLPSTFVTLTGGTGGIFTYTFCPNGMVYGSAAVCHITSNAVNNAAPGISITYKGRQTNINVSSVGNVSTTIVH